MRFLFPPNSTVMEADKDCTTEELYELFFKSK